MRNCKVNEKETVHTGQRSISAIIPKLNKNETRRERKNNKCEYEAQCKNKVEWSEEEKDNLKKKKKCADFVCVSYVR